MLDPSTGYKGTGAVVEASQVPDMNINVIRVVARFSVDLRTDESWKLEQNQIMSMFIYFWELKS